MWWLSGLQHVGRKIAEPFQRVAALDWSEIAHGTVAMVGVFGYLLMLAGCLWGIFALAQQHPAVRLFLLGLVLFLFASGVQKRRDDR